MAPLMLQEAILANRIVIVDCDPSWPATFKQFRDRLATTLGPFAVAIEHIGSTAAPVSPPSRSSIWTW